MRRKEVNTSICIILPVRNEEKRIRRCMERILSYCKEKEWDFELFVVMDDSTDNTSSILNEFSLSESRIKVLNLTARLGKGGAIICGAFSPSTKEYMAYMDADLAADPSELERLLEYIEDHDIVLGSRILRGNLGRIKRPFWRSLFSHLYSRLFRILFRIPIHDPQCGFKLFRMDIIPKLFGQVTMMGFAFDTDMIVTAFTQGLRIREVPINWTHGKSSTLSIPTEIRSMGLDLLSIWYYSHLSWLQNKSNYPQKKGSIYGKVLFALLSLSSEIKMRPLKYPKIIQPVAGVDQK